MKLRALRIVHRYQLDGSPEFVIQRERWLFGWRDLYRFDGEARCLMAFDSLREALDYVPVLFGGWYKQGLYGSAERTES